MKLSNLLSLNASWTKTQELFQRYASISFSIVIRARSDILSSTKHWRLVMSFSRENVLIILTPKAQQQNSCFSYHDMDAVQRYCTTAILIQDGEIVLEGDPQSAAKKYTEINMQGV